MSVGGPWLVTGASGFVGRSLLHRLLQEGIAVRAAVRRQDSGVAANVERVLVPDVGNRDAVRAAVSGAAAVVHLAGVAHVVTDAPDGAQRDAYRHVNVDGTRVLLEEAERAGVPRFLFVSSVLAVAQQSDEPLDEQTPPHPVTAYGVSKLAAEELVRDVGSRSGMRTTILRPPLLYGPGMRANMLALFRLAGSRIPLPLASIRNRRSVLFVENLSYAILHAVRNDGAAGETFFLSDSTLSTPQLVAAIRQALGRPVRLFPVPPRALHAAARAVDPIAGALGLPRPSGLVNRLLGSLPVDSSYIAARLAFQPPYSFEEGLARTAGWFLRECAA